MKIKCSKIIIDNIDKFDELIRTAQKVENGYIVPNNKENEKIIEIFTKELIGIEDEKEIVFTKLIEIYKIINNGIFFMLSTGNLLTTGYDKLDVIKNIKKLKK